MTNQATSSPKRNKLFWWIGGAIAFLALAILSFSIIRGYQDGLMRQQMQRRQEIAIHLQQAEDLRAEGNRQAALAEYQQVLLLDPQNEEAISGIGRLLEEPTDGGTTGLPTANKPTPTPTPMNPLELTWADAQALYSIGRWEEAIDRLLEVKAADPEFHAEQVEDMLYTAYVSLGTEKSNAGSLEEAVNLFDKALALRPNAVEIRTMRDVTAQYVDALTYWYADWPRVISLLEDLYQRNPNYRDVRQRLQEAHLDYAETLARQGNWCDAAEQYSEAITIQNGPGLAEKESEFQLLCSQNPTGTAVNPDGTPDAASAVTPPPPGSLGIGRILYSSKDPVDGRFHVFAQPVTANVRPVVIADDALQPDLRSDGQRLAFRSTRGDMIGIGSFDPATGLRLRFTSFGEDQLPSWSPKGDRLVFASQREGDRRWRIYVAWADGKDNGSSLVFGQDPDWHPTEDLIVYRGCDDRGNECGLWTMRSDGTNRTPLTQVPGDARPTWSPDGRYIVFMSQERDGNWEIYRLDVNDKSIVRMTNDPNVDGLPAVSPDGSRIAFLSNRDGQWKIWIKPITGGHEQPLASLTGNVDDWMSHTLDWVP
jgi:tetratricopeptide (TPR) repeat protein